MDRNCIRGTLVISGFTIRYMTTEKLYAVVSTTTTTSIDTDRGHRSSNILTGAHKKLEGIALFFLRP